MSIKGILFDKDGTLIEVNGTWVPLYKSMLPEAFGHSEQEVVDLLVSAGYDIDTDGFKAGSILAGGTTEQLVKVWWPDLPAVEQKRRVHFINNEIAPQAKKFVKPLMDLAPVFDELHQLGMVLGLGTNDSEASGKAHMQHLDVHHYFDVIIGADSVASPKPSGQMIELFARSAKLKPENIAMVGDNSHDMEEARAGGAGLAIAVLSGNAARSDIAHLADFVVDSVADLPKLFRTRA